MGHETNVRIHLPDNSNTIDPTVKAALTQDLCLSFRTSGTWGDTTPIWTGWWPTAGELKGNCRTLIMTFRGYFDSDNRTVLQNYVERHLPGVLLFWEPIHSDPQSGRSVVTGGTEEERCKLLTRYLRQDFEDELERAIAGGELELSRLRHRIRR